LEFFIISPYSTPGILAHVYRGLGDGSLTAGDENGKAKANIPEGPRIVADVHYNGQLDLPEQVGLIISVLDQMELAPTAVNIMFLAGGST
jgi:hypothetical protein